MRDQTQMLQGAKVEEEKLEWKIIQPTSSERATYSKIRWTTT